MGSVSGSYSEAAGKGSSKNKSRVSVPAYLRPLVEQGASTGARTLRTLDNMLNTTPDNLVAGFTAPQQVAQLLGIQRALDDDGLFSTAQNTILGAARGASPSSFIDNEALDTLSSMQSGGLDYLPDSVMRSLSGGGREIGGTNLLESLAGSAIPPETRARLAAGGDLRGMEALTGLQGGGLDPTAMDALERTAAGDFLYGGDGFNAAIEAAVRAAQPGIISTFGRAGPGAATGALAQAAIGQAGIDAFASQFGQERQRQLGAAQTLADLGLTQTGQQADIASTIAGLDLSGRQLDANMAETLAQLGLADTQQQAGIGQALAGIDLDLLDSELAGATTLAGLSDSQQGRSLSAANLLADIGRTERGNQLDAATLLPSIGTADLDLLNAIGSDQQQLEQAFLTAPINAQLQILGAALGGLPISSLLGSNNRTDSWSRQIAGSVSGGSGIG